MLLQSRHIEIVIIDYLNTPPSAHEIDHTLTLLRLQPRQLMRTNEREYKTLNFDDVGLTRAQLIAAMHEHPILIQRPVVFANGMACIGRPPAAVLDIL